MVINSKKKKIAKSGLWVLSILTFVFASGCSTSSKKEIESTDKVETTSNESAEHPSDSLEIKDSEHPSNNDSSDSEHPSVNDKGSEHASDDGAEDEHPTDASSDSEHPK